MSTLNALDFVEMPVFAMVFTDDQTPTIAFWNTRAEALTGLDRGEVLGKSPIVAIGSLAEPLMSTDWASGSGQVTIEGLGQVKLSALADKKTTIATILASTLHIDDKEREMFLGMASQHL